MKGKDMPKHVTSGIIKINGEGERELFDSLFSIPEDESL